MKRIGWMLGGICALAALGGCGGGGAASSGTGAGPGGGSGGGALTPDQRAASYQAITDEINALRGQPRAAINPAIIKFLSARPEFTSVEELPSGCIVATYADGLPYVIYHNLDASAAPGRAAWTKRVTRLATGLPDKGQARIISGLADWLNRPEHGGPDATPDLQEWARANGYHIAAGDASLLQLEFVQGDGFFYIHTHGCTINVGPAPAAGQPDTRPAIYTLYTSTVADPKQPLPAELQDDLDHHRIFPCAAINDTDVGLLIDTPVESTHYCITDDFVRVHGWKFSTNSFVFINACESYTPKSGPFQLAIHDAGASIYAGWTEEANNGVANTAARFLVDRLLGSNQFMKEDPPQRPFDIASVKADFDARGMGHSEFTGPGGVKHVADLKIVPMNDQSANDQGFGLLAPSISFVTVFDPLRQLVIYGQFGRDWGADRRSVTVSGAPLDVVSWAQDKIVCSIPDSGPGSAGDVIVSVDGRKSNVVQLSDWRGKVTYTYQADPTLTWTFVFNLHLRGDVHLWRTAPGTAPQGRGFGVTCARDSTCHYHAGGQHTYELPGPSTLDMRWSGDGDLPILYTAPKAQSNFDCGVQIDPLALTMKLHLLALADGGNAVTRILTIAGQTQPPQTSQEAVFFDPTIFDDVTGNQFNIQLRSDYTIPARDKTINVTYVNSGSGTVTIHWDDMKPSYPPDPDAARSIHPRRR